MEQIIEIFADAISAFILKSISLQEENAIPGPELRKNGAVVVETSQTLVAITRDVANNDYRDFPDIQSPILDCARNVEIAVDLLGETMGILFKETDRAVGWRKLVESTKNIGMETSRLLVIIYGAEEKRLRRAGEAAKAALRKVQKHTAKDTDTLRATLKDMADDTGDASSKVVQFNTFVGGRFQTESDPDAKDNLKKCFDDINKENQVLVTDANGVITKPGEQQPRQNFVGTTNRLIDLIDEVLGNVKKPEDLDVYKIIEDLFSSGNKAVMTEARPYEDIRDKGPYSKRDLQEAGRKVIEAMEKVKKHPELTVEDVINDTNIGSARIANFGEMTTVFAYQPENDSLKPSLLTCCDGLTRENGNLVGDCNDYVGTQKSGGPVLTVGNDVDDALQGVKGNIREAIQGAGKFARSTGTNGFIPAAKSLTTDVKELLQGVSKMIAAVGDTTDTKALSEKGQDAKAAISRLIKAGQVVHKEPNNGPAREALKSAVGQLKANIQGLLGEANAVSQKASLSSAPSSGTGPRKNKQGDVLNGTADRVIDLVKKVLEEIDPPFNKIRDRKGPTSLSASEIDRDMLQRLADDALRMLEQLKGYPRFTPKETLQALEYAVEAVDLFDDRLGTKADAMQLKKLKEIMQKAVKNIKAGNAKMIDSCEKYVGEPNSRNDKEFLGDINYLQDEIRGVMKELSPGDIAKNRERGRYYSNVDPKQIESLGEEIKRSDKKIRSQVTDATPKEVAKEADENVARGDKFTDLVESLAQDSRNPAFKNLLNRLADELRPAVTKLADTSNDYLYDPDDSRRQNNVKDATVELDRLIDQVLAAIMPEAEYKKGKSAGNMSAAQLQRLAEEVKRSAKELDDDFRTNAPQETVREAEETQQKAADFGEAVKERGDRSNNKAYKDELDSAVSALSKEEERLLKATNEHLKDPNNRGKQEDLSKTTKEVRERVDDIMKKIRPQAEKPKKQTHRGKVTPKDIEREARKGQDKLKRDRDFDKEKPTTVVANAENTGDQVELVRAMLETLANDQDRPAQRRKIQELADKLEKKNNDLVDATNEYIDDTESGSAKRSVQDKNEDLDKFLEEVIKQVKPRVKKSEGDFKGDYVTPQSLSDMADEVRAAIKKVKNEHKKVSGDELAKDTGHASKKVDTFKQMVDKRSKIEKRPKLSKILSDAVPKLDDGNKRMVDGSNDYIADPNNKTSGEVDDSCQSLLDLIDDIMGEVNPQAKLTTASDLAGQNFGGLTNAQLKASYDAVRAAVVKTQKFPEHMPKETAENSSKASKLVAIFAEQLRARSKEDPVRKMADKLLKACNDLHDENGDLVKATNRYIGEPEDERNADDLDGSCQSILDTLDNIWGEIDAQATKQKVAANARDNVNPRTLEDMADRLRKAVKEVEQHRDFTPKEIVDATNNESGLASTFAEMVDEYGNIVPQLKDFLKDASKRVDRANDDIVDDANKAIQDRSDNGKKKNLDKSCQVMKDLIDEIMAKVKPEITGSKVGQNNLKNMSNKDLTDAANQLILACENTQKFKDDAPKTTADKTTDTSKKAIYLADVAKSVADSTTNKELKRVLDNAFRELPPANDTLIEDGEKYLEDPAGKREQKDFDDALENLKRIARDILKEAEINLGKADLDNNVARNCTMEELRKAYNKAKADLAKQQKFDSVAPSRTAEATKESVESTNTFKNLAAARAKDLDDSDRSDKANDAINKLDKDNRELYPDTQAYLDESSKKNSNNLKKTGNTIDQDLDEVFNSVKPRAVYTKADFSQKQRDVTNDEISGAAAAAKKAIKPVGEFAHNEDEITAEAATDASRRIARFNELIYLKTGDKKMPAVAGSKLREVSKDVLKKNKNLVDATNNYLDEPEDPDNVSKLRNAVRQANYSIDKGAQAVKDASASLQSFEDKIEAASNAISDAANEWDAGDEIVSAALRIAIEMRKLAQAARDHNRKEIILRARNISALVKSEIVSYANKRRAACNNVTVRKDLSTGTTALGSFSIQLKIIASVKAAELGVGKDRTAENQLVACCQGISKSMRATLKAAQSAKLLSK